MRRVGAFHFRVERVVYDPLSNELVVMYDRTLRGETKRKTEHFRFHGQLVHSAAAYDGASR